MASIYREQTLDERRDFRDISPYKKPDAKTNFLTDLAKKRAEKTKQKIPFFKKAALDDFEEYYRGEVIKSKKKNGFVKLSDIKPIKMDWKKYSSPDNIKFVEMTVQRDAYASKKQPFEVFVRVYRYKYDGYGKEGASNISIMEDETDAVKRLKAEYENKPFEEISQAEKISQRYDRKKKKGIIDSIKAGADPNKS